MLKYKEIKKSLLEIIRGMKEQEKLPSRPFLCEKLDTTRVTLDKAIHELVDEGYLISEKGSGTYIAPMNTRELKHNSWGIIVPNIMEPIYAGIVRGVENVAQLNNISLTLCNSDNDFQKQEKYLLRFIQSRIEGLILVPVISKDVEKNSRLYYQLMAADIPFVFCNRNVEGVDAPTVTSNDYYGAYLGTKHLISNGYKNIGFISRINYSTSINRCYGYLTAIMENKLEINRQNVIMEEEDSSELPGYISMQRLLERDPSLDAVFCFSDELAEGVYKAIKEKGLKVSDDIGVIGYNNTASLCESLTPRLTSLSYQNMEVGRIAANVLMKLINKNPISDFNIYLMQPEIVHRGSCLGRK